MIRTFLIFEIRTTSPTLTVGEPSLDGDDDDIDRPVLRRPDGPPYIPASSLVGSLRVHLDAMELAVDLLGGGSSDEAAPSKIRFLGTELSFPCEPDEPDKWIRRRGRTAIDRKRGAAADRRLWQEQALIEGAMILLIGYCDSPLEDSHWKALRCWEPRIGSMRTGGYGRTELKRIRYGCLDFEKEDDRKRWIESASKVDRASGGVNRVSCLVDDEFEPLPAQTDPIIEVRFNVADALLIDGAIGLDSHGDGGESQVMRSRRRNDDAVWIEGSSWKGLFRSRCEFIVRSIERSERLCESCSTGKPSDDGERPCLICELFGSTKRRGALEFLASKVEGAVPKTLTRTAVDRLSGGAADSKLFTIETICQGSITLRILWIGAKETPEWVVPFLNAVVCDIADGYLGVGAMISQGFGTLCVEDGDRPEMSDLLSLLERQPDLDE